MLDQKKSNSKDLFIFPVGRAENKFHSYETQDPPALTDIWNLHLYSHHYSQNLKWFSHLEYTV